MSMSPKVTSSMVVDDAMFDGGNHMMDNPFVGDTVPSQVLSYVSS